MSGGQIGLKLTNAEHEAEKKADQEKLEKRIGLLNYLVDKDSKYTWRQSYITIQAWLWLLDYAYACHSLIPSCPSFFFACRKKKRKAKKVGYDAMPATERASSCCILPTQSRTLSRGT